MKNHRGSCSLSRRALLRNAGLGLAGASITPAPAFPAARAPERQTVPSGEAAALAPLNRAPRVMQDFFVARVRRIEAEGVRRRAALRTGADAEAYVREVREKIQRCFGPWPEKTPLAPRVTGVLERDGYRIEKVIFDSRPGFPVTANLYVPARSSAMPGVVAVCGHSANGKANETYQSFVQGLARQGYVTLILDPLGQGERAQYGGKPGQVADPVREHNRAGAQQFLVGEFVGAWRAWDAIRALDYLLTRPEVDRHHVGVTGNSGGGTLTTWLLALDSRWTMGAPSCFVTTFRRNLENELPADAEQCPPRALALGLDHADFIAAHAPKPVLLLGQEKDYFDARGLEEAYGRLRSLYGLLGAEENVRLFIGPDQHGYHRANREAMYAFFNGITKISSAKSEPELALEKDEALWCTGSGQVTELKARTVFDFTGAASRNLAKARGEVSGGPLTKAVSEILHLPARPSVPAYRILRPAGVRRYPRRPGASYAIETEPNVLVFVHRLAAEPVLSRLPRAGKRAVLYVSHRSADAELRDEPLVRELIAAEPAVPLYACDVRGIGDSRPNTCGDVDVMDHYGADYFYAIHGIMCDYPIVGQRTHDLLQVLEWLAAAGHEDVHLAAMGLGAIPATFAALLSPRVTQVTLKHALASYADVAQTERYTWPLSSFLPGVLQTFDLPDCYRALGAKRLRQVEPWDASAPLSDRAR